MANDWLTLHWGETLVDDLGLLIRDLCVGYGDCNFSVHAESLLDEGNGIVTASAVAHATLAAEGITDPWRQRYLERLFVYRYGKVSIAGADYALRGERPYGVVPPLSDADRGEPDPVLIAARAWVFDEVAMPLQIDVDAVKQSIQRVRGRWDLGVEEASVTRKDMRALIVVHERLTGQFWISDARSRAEIGLGVDLGSIAV